MGEIIDFIGEKIPKNYGILQLCFVGYSQFRMQIYVSIKLSIFAGSRQLMIEVLFFSHKKYWNCFRLLFVTNEVLSHLKSLFGSAT